MRLPYINKCSDAAFSSELFILNFEDKVVKTWHITQQVMKMDLGFVGQWVEIMAAVSPHQQKLQALLGVFFSLHHRDMSFWMPWHHYCNYSPHWRDMWLSVRMSRHTCQDGWCHSLRHSLMMILTWLPHKHKPQFPYLCGVVLFRSYVWFSSIAVFPTGWAFTCGGGWGGVVWPGVACFGVAWHVMSRFRINQSNEGLWILFIRAGYCQGPTIWFN